MTGADIESHVLTLFQNSLDEICSPQLLNKVPREGASGRIYLFY